MENITDQLLKNKLKETPYIVYLTNRIMGDDSCPDIVIAKFKSYDLAEDYRISEETTKQFIKQGYKYCCIYNINFNDGDPLAILDLKKYLENMLNKKDRWFSV